MSKGEYIPQRITLTREVGFDENTSRKIGEIAEAEGRHPREVASRLLREAVQRAAEHLEREAEAYHA